MHADIMYLKQQQLCYYCTSLALVFAVLEFVSSQTFYRNCNAPEIIQHLPDFGHTYCAHACRPGNEADATCSATGNCVCVRPCSNAASPRSTPSNDICPPSSRNPRDTDSTYSEASCLASCANECAGGTGIRCEEIPFAFATLPPNTFANVCTCTCPAVCDSALSGSGNTTNKTPLWKLSLLKLKKKKKKIWVILKIWLCGNTLIRI